MTYQNPQDVLNAAASIFNSLQPVIAVLVGISLGLGLLRMLLREMSFALGVSPLRTDDLGDDDQGDGDPDGDEFTPEKPKNDPSRPKSKAVGMNADGEIVYSDQPETPFFYQRDDSKLG